MFVNYGYCDIIIADKFVSHSLRQIFGAKSYKDFYVFCNFFIFLFVITYADRLNTEREIYAVILFVSH